MKGLREDGWEPELYTLVLGTLDEIPSTAVQVLEEIGVRGIELDKLIEDIHMIAVGNADEYKRRFHVMRSSLWTLQGRIVWDEQEEGSRTA